MGIIAPYTEGCCLRVMLVLACAFVGSDSMIEGDAELPELHLWSRIKLIFDVGK